MAGSSPLQHLQAIAVAMEQKDGDAADRVVASRHRKQPVDVGRRQWNGGGAEMDDSLHRTSWIAAFL